jgi:hypothetical protein
MIYNVPERRWLGVATSVRATHLWVQPEGTKLLDPSFSVEGYVVNTDGFFAHMFRDSAIVTLSSADDALIVYALDSDSLPVSQWRPYTAPLVVKEAHMIYATCLPRNGAGGVEQSAIRRFMCARSSWYEGIAFGTPVDDYPKKGKTAADLNTFEKAFDGIGGKSEFRPIPAFVDRSIEPAGTSADVFAGVALKLPRKLVRASVQANSGVSNVKVQGSNAAWNTGYETLVDMGSGGTVELKSTGARAYRYYRLLFPAQSEHSIVDIDFAFGEADSTTLSAPSVDPPGGEFQDSVRVTIESTAPDATVRYTLDGSDPTLSSPSYTGPIVLREGSTLTAAAVRSDTLSAQTRVVFTKVAAQLAAPTLSPAGAVFDNEVIVTVTSDAPGAQVYYTLDGTAPSTNAHRYTDPVRIDRTTLIKASAFQQGMRPSSPVWGLYVTAQDKAKGAGVVLYPNGGEQFRVGDTVVVRWQTFDPETFSAAVVEVSVDDGRNWHGVNTRSNIHIQSDGWGNYTWVIPAQLEGTAMASDACRLRVGEYNGDVVDYSDGRFVIKGANSAVNGPRTLHARPGLTGFHAVRAGASARRLIAEGARYGLVSVYTARGRRVGTSRAAGARVPDLPSEGVYIVRIEPRGRAVCRTDK